ncbi:MAG: glycosyltransferase family 2 protein, partial [Nonlabens sp.]
YYKWKVVTIDQLLVKHLKPTGASYHTKSLRHQGEAFYKMRLGLILTVITAFKMSLKKRSIAAFLEYLKGYWQASRAGVARIIDRDQGKFLRNYRWKGIKQKMGF